MGRSVHQLALAATVTVSANGTKLDGQRRGKYDAVALISVAGAVSGTNPTLSYIIEVSPDNGTTWFTVGTSTAITATAQSQRLVVAGLVEPYVRCSPVVGGTATPSFGGVTAFLVLASVAD